MVGGAVMGYLGGIHFWWPKISGRMYPEAWGRLAALIVFLGFNLTFFPQFIRRISRHASPLLAVSAGISGVQRALHRRRQHSGGRIFIADGLLAVVVGYGKPAPDNPWQAPALEWRTSSPPPTFNFEETPEVTWEAYEYDTMPMPDEVTLER